MTSVYIRFAGPGTAAAAVAGVPAAARAVRHAIADRPDTHFDNALLVVPGGWHPDAACRDAFARLAPGVAIRVVEPNDPPAAGRAMLRGELPEAVQGAVPDDPQAALALWEDLVLFATAKPSDGIVSRTLNRPISRWITRRVLRLPGARPVHATAANLVVAVAMAGCLLLGGGTGAVAGALLFHAASVLDGVDGEMARATFRASARGAMLDSLTDAATNIAFLGGLAANVWMRGDAGAGIAGASGLVLLIAGTWLLGRRAHRDGGDFTFDAVKHHFRARPTPLKRVLVWITMRDFLAAAAVVLVLAGLAAPGLYAFAAIAVGWFAVTLAVLARRRVETS